MSKVTAKQLKEYLLRQSQAELIKDITELFGKSDAVKEYYQMRVSGGSDSDLLDKYKAAIKKEFFPARGHGEGRLSIARKPVLEYKKIAASPANLADLMLYYVEMGVEFTNTYGDIDEPFYNSMTRMYVQAVKLIIKEKLQEQLEERCEQIVFDTSGIGWGFHDDLSAIYDENFG